MVYENNDVFPIHVHYEAVTDKILCALKYSKCINFNDFCNGIRKCHTPCAKNFAS